MDITEFFQQSAGKWFSQLSTHQFAFKQSGSGKSNIVIDMLDTADPAVVKLCQQHNVDPAQALCGVKVSWDGTMDNEEKRAGSSVLVPIASADSASEGMLLRAGDAAASRYVVGSDEAVTLITESETLYSEERVWFASPNLRFRTNVLKEADGFSMATFCSEIRMGVAPAKSPAAATEAT